MVKKAVAKKQVNKGASRTVEKQPLRIVLPFKMIGLTMLVMGCLLGGYYAVINMPTIDFSWHGDEVVDIEAVIVDAPLEQVSEADIRKVVVPYMAKDFYSIALDQLQFDLLALPWIDAAVIKRQWPNKISISLREKTVIARWGEDQLLTQKGDMFTPGTMRKSLLLPELAGPDGMQVRVMELYLELTLLLGTIEPKITRLVVDERYNWTLVLDNDVRLILGNELMVERLRRFVTLFSELKSQPQSIDYVDFRHANGFAVGWKNNKMKNANG